MKILHIIIGIDVGGAEMMLLKVVNGLSKRGHVQLIISLTGNNTLKESFEKAGAEVKCLNLQKYSQILKMLYKIRKYQKTFQPDIIQSWMYHADSIAAITKPMKVPLIWNVRHSLDDYDNESTVVLFLIRLASILSLRVTKILFNSEKSLTQHIAKGFPQSKSYVIPNGFDPERFSPNILINKENKKKLKIEEDAFVIGHIGRYHIVKNHKSLLESIAILEKKNLNRKIVLLLAGKDVDENNVELADRIHRNSLKSRVILLGAISEPEKIFPIFDMFCLSSYSEAFPNVLGEAMSCGVPCASTDVGDAKRIIGDTGVIMSSPSSTDIAEAIYNLISLSIHQRLILGEKARQRIIDLYSIEKIIDQYEQLYTKLLL